MTLKQLVSQACRESSPHILDDAHQAQLFTQGLLSQVPPKQHPALVRRLRALERAWQVVLPLPLILPAPRRPQPLRRADWAERSERIFALHDLLERRLSCRKGRPEDFAGLALMSAILKGGLLRREAWPVFCQEVARGARFFRSGMTGDLVWMDLQLPRRAGRAAQEPKEETLRFYPDCVTLSLVARARGAYLPLSLSPKNALQIGTAALGSSYSETLLEDIEQAAFAVLEDQSPLPIPSVLFEVASGQLPAFSAAKEVWHNALSGTCRKAPITTKSNASLAAKQRQTAAKLDETGSLFGLQRAISTQSDQAQKPTKAPVIAALKAFLVQQPSAVMTAMALWLLDLLQRGRALGTIKRYAGSLARGLAGRFGQEDPANMSPAEIEVLLEDVLSLMPAQERIYQSARLRQLWDFVSSDPRLWWPEIDLAVEGRSNPSVRTALVFGTMITQLLKHFEGRPSYQAAVLLASRGGLRLSDMEALRVGDVEVQPNGMLLIHPTLWSDLKTSSARRVLPFERFLTPEERKIWQKFLTLKRLSVSSADASLLSDGHEIDQQQNFNRHLFAKSLSVMGLRPHDLRHGALCNLALLLFVPNPLDPLISRMTGWNRNSLETLQKLLIGNDPWRGTKALARLAGHYDPKTTFESYIHICDFALGLHVRSASPPGEPDMILCQLGLNRRSLPKKKGRITAESLRARVLKRLSIKDVVQAPKASRQATTPAPSEMTISLFLQIEKAFSFGRNVLEIANDFDLPFRVVNKLAARPRLRSLRGKRDQKRLLELCETLLSHPDARSWALQVQKAPMHGIIFYAPTAASLWHEVASENLDCEAELQSNRPALWGKWGKMRLQKPAKEDRLILRPLSPDGVKGMRLAKQAAQIILALLEANEEIKINK